MFSPEIKANFYFEASALTKAELGSKRDCCFESPSGRAHLTFANIPPCVPLILRENQVFMNFQKSHNLVPKYLAFKIGQDRVWVMQAWHKTSTLNLLKLLLNGLQSYDLDSSHQYVLLFKLVQGPTLFIK